MTAATSCTVTVVCDQKEEIDVMSNQSVPSQNDIECRSSNAFVVDESSIGLAKKFGEAQWEKMRNVLKANSFRLSYDLLYNPFRQRSSDDTTQASLPPMLVERQRQKIEDLPQSNNGTILSGNPEISELKIAVSFVETSVAPPDSLYNADDNEKILLGGNVRPSAATKADPTPLRLLKNVEVSTSNDNGTLMSGDPKATTLPNADETEFVVNMSTCSPDSLNLVDGEEDMSLIEMACASRTELKVDPAPPSLIQGRLQNVAALSAADTTEVMCIRHAYLTVTKGYQHLTEAMLEVQSLVELLPHSRPSSSSTNYAVIELMSEQKEIVDISGDDVNNPSNESTLSERNFIETLQNDNFFEEFVAQSDEVNDCMGPCLDEIAPTTYFDADQRKMIIPSPCSTQYTYRGDDTFDDEVFIFSTTSNDLAMPVVFASPVPKSKWNDDELRSLLSQKTMVYRPYSYRRLRRLQFGKCVVPQLLCAR
jgi:hypothetical protein